MKKQIEIKKIRKIIVRDERFWNNEKLAFPILKLVNVIDFNVGDALSFKAVKDLITNTDVEVTIIHHATNFSG